MSKLKREEIVSVLQSRFFVAIYLYFLYIFESCEAPEVLGDGGERVIKFIP